MTIKEDTTGRGGNVGYKMVRSKVVKGPDGHGKMVTAAREALMQKLGRDPGPNIVAAHKGFGAHHGSDQAARWETRAYNTAESDYNHDGSISIKDKIALKKYKQAKTKPTPKGITEKLNANRRRDKSGTK